MTEDHDLDNFILRFAKKIAALYQSNCSDEDDYIQAAHLKLAEINSNNFERHNDKAYAITAIARAMRETALNSICAVSAPYRIKKLIHMIDILTYQGRTDKEIQTELGIDEATLLDMKALMISRSWENIYSKPSHNSQQFSVINDILSSCHLTKEDRLFLKNEFLDNEQPEMTRKQRWMKKKALRQKIIRSGYGI